MLYWSIEKYIKVLYILIIMKRILVSIPDGTWKIIEKRLKGKLGDKESELIRNIILAYLSEKGYFKEEEK